ncbi:MAG: DUF5012 domain-containing protein [Bacteroidales bacterium]|nr:DUF5012 domain-containing protein [Bacteroidales bacterium]
MKKIYNILILILLVAFISSCEKELTSEGVSRITYFPEMTMTGADVIFLPLGTAYTELGVTATEKGNQINITTSTSGIYHSYSGNTVDANAANKYVLKYTATNSDGFSAFLERVVYVAKTGDLVNSIEGLYTSTVVRNGASGAQYTNMKYVMIWKTGTNTYQISDGIGGYYDLGRNYGSTYMASGGIVTANNIAANDFTFGPGFPAGAFGGVVTLTSMSVDAAAKTVTFKSTWDSGYNFVVTLKQVQI